MAYLEILQSYNLSITQWLLVFLSAFIIGISKSGIKGIGILVVVIFAFVFGERSSTGVLLPLLVISIIGVFSGQTWAYALWLSLGILSIYFSILFWVLEKAYTYPSYGWVAYYTYFWGFFFYWGIGATVYSLIRII